MDVDEFLDRELSDIDSNPAIKNPIGIDASQFKESFEPSPLFDEMKSNLEKGNLDEAERIYMQLWHVLANENFKWDKSMYEQLLVLCRQISSAVSSSFTALKEKSDHVNELISRARTSLREGKKDAAFKTYGEIQAINSSVPNAFFEEKKIIQDQILSFYQELKSSNDAELLRRIESMVNEITLGIERINSSFQKGDMQGAISEYSKCLRTYNQIPEGFLKHRNPLGLRLLDIYKNLSIYNEIANLQKQISITPRSFEPISRIERPQRQPQLGPQMPSPSPKPEIRFVKEQKPEAQSGQSPAAQMGFAQLAQIKEQATAEAKDAKAEAKPAREPLQRPKDTSRRQSPRKRYESRIDAIKELTKDKEKANPQNLQIAEVSSAGTSSTSSSSLSDKIASAKKNFERGFYNEASKDVDEALKIEPSDAEAKALRAKIKTWQ